MTELTLEPSMPEIPDSYQRARKQYSLFSGLLLAWELVGFEVSEAPLENISVKLKSPQAVPYVFIALIFYFGFRTMIEWYQIELRRRSLSAVQVDLYVAHGLAALSILLYGLQTALRFQLADEISPFMFVLILLCALAGDACVHLAQTLRAKERSPKAVTTWTLLILVGIAAVSLASKNGGSIVWPLLGVFGFGMGVVLGLYSGHLMLLKKVN